jgi:hypothetical protein
MRIICVMLLVLSFSTSFAQPSLDGIEDVYQFTSMEEALAKPDSVYSIEVAGKTQQNCLLNSSRPSLIWWSWTLAETA